MYLTLECTTIRKFGLNKSGYLISIVKDQYFYWTDLKKTDKSPHTLHSILHTLHTFHVDFVTFSHVECKLATSSRKKCRQSSPHIFDMLFFCVCVWLNLHPTIFILFSSLAYKLLGEGVGRGGGAMSSPSPFSIFQSTLFRAAPPFPLLYPSYC